jgi:hypothetical protein
MATEDKRPEKPAARGGAGAFLPQALLLLLLAGLGIELIWRPVQGALEDEGAPPLLAAALPFVVSLVLIGLWAAWSTKEALLAAIPDEVEFRAARAEDYADLDAERLARYTQALEALGFTHLIDYTTAADVPRWPKGFARLFVHREEHCFAEVNQVFRSGGKRVPLRCALLSRLADGWSLWTSDRQPRRESHAMRRPRTVRRYLPGERTASLLEAHLEMGRRMAHDLGLAVVTEDTAEAYFARARRDNRARKEAVRGRSGVRLLLDLFLFDMSPKTEWLGEYAGKAGEDA